MAAKIGILGESTQLTTGTVTVYTVPADKAARVRILYGVQAPSSSYAYDILVGMPGNERSILHGNQTNSDIDVWSGIVAKATPVPALSLTVDDNGMQAKDGGLGGTWASSAGVDYAVLPLAVDFFLSVGDTVRVIIGTNDLGDHVIQVHGVEDDA